MDNITLNSSDYIETQIVLDRWSDLIENNFKKSFETKYSHKETKRLRQNVRRGGYFYNTVATGKMRDSIKTSVNIDRNLSEGVKLQSKYSIGIDYDKERYSFISSGLKPGVKVGVNRIFNWIKNKEQFRTLNDSKERRRLASKISSTIFDTGIEAKPFLKLILNGKSGNEGIDESQKMKSLSINWRKFRREVLIAVKKDQFNKLISLSNK